MGFRAEAIRSVGTARHTVENIPELFQNKGSRLDGVAAAETFSESRGRSQPETIDHGSFQRGISLLYNQIARE